MALVFFILSFLFILAGGTVFIPTVYQAKYHNLTVALYAIAQFFFNLGPNALIYIMSAELFRTEYRGTFYGIAAAFGKLGAIIIQIAMHYGGLGGAELKVGKLGALLCSFSVIMFGAGLVAWRLPDVQILSQSSDSAASSSGENGGRQATVKKKQKRPIFGKYENLSLEEIAQQLDEQIDGKAEGDEKHREAKAATVTAACV